MSLFSSLILPHLEREILALQPQMAQFILEQLRNAGNEIVNWAEIKLNADINGDGKIGGGE